MKGGNHRTESVAQSKNCCRSVRGLISALLTASNSLAAAFQVLADSRFENAVLPVTDRLRPLRAVAKSEEGSLGMILKSLSSLQYSHIFSSQSQKQIPTLNLDLGSSSTRPGTRRTKGWNCTMRQAISTISTRIRG